MRVSKAKTFPETVNWKEEMTSTTDTSRVLHSSTAAIYCTNVSIVFAYTGFLLHGFLAISRQRYTSVLQQLIQYFCKAF